jgi:CP family cyanate transporter-like MFS transporter
MIPSQPGARLAQPNFFAVLALLWLAGLAMRLPLLVIPPVLPLIHEELHMSETQVGALIGMPLTMFALAAIPGSLLIARFGAMRIAVAGLLLTAIAAASRGAAVDVWMLYGVTLVMGFGISILQPTMPTLVRAWIPQRMWLANAVYTNGLTIGVVLGPTLTFPLVLPLVGGSWRRDLAVWAIPGLIAALAYVAVAQHPSTSAATRPVPDTPLRWWPSFGDPLIWLLGIALGTNNALFFAANGFVPDFLTSTGRGDWIGITLGWLNGSQLAASLIFVLFADRLQRHSWPFTIFGPATVLGTIGIVLGDGVWITLSAIVLGFAAAITFVVTFGLPAILSPPDDVHRMAGGMFTISYTIAVLTPILCGAFWDITGVPWTAFVPIGICGVGLTIFGTILTVRRA